MWLTIITKIKWQEYRSRIVTQCHKRNKIQEICLQATCCVLCQIVNAEKNNRKVHKIISNKIAMLNFYLKISEWNIFYRYILYNSTWAVNELSPSYTSHFLNNCHMSYYHYQIFACKCLLYWSPLTQLNYTKMLLTTLFQEDINHL
jgi:hypothetical protein